MDYAWSFLGFIIPLAFMCAGIALVLGIYQYIKGGYQASHDPKQSSGQVLNQLLTHSLRMLASRLKGLIILILGVLALIYAWDMLITAFIR